MIFKTAQQVKDYIATLSPSECRIEPHYSSSYIWNVYHPESFGRLSFGFSSERSLLSWANSVFVSTEVDKAEAMAMEVEQSIEYFDRYIAGDR